MDPKTQVRLRKVFDTIMDQLSAAGGVSYEKAATSIQPHLSGTDSFIVLLLSKITQDMNPMSEGSSLPIEFFNEENLGMIDSREKFYSMLADLPEEAAPEIEQFLNYALKKGIPSERSELQQLAKSLPASPGGAPPKMPSEAVCRQICDEISKLYERGVSMREAQKRAVQKWNLSLRTIQRIWQLWGPKRQNVNDKIES
jgi:hypothetical protein